MPHSCASHSTHHTWDAWLSGCVTTALLRVCLCPGRGATVRTHQPSARSARCFSICTLTAALRADVCLWGGGVAGWDNQHAPPGSLFSSYWLARLRTQAAATPFDGELEQNRDEYGYPNT